MKLLLNSQLSFHQPTTWRACALLVIIAALGQQACAPKPEQATTRASVQTSEPAAVGGVTDAGASRPVASLPLVLSSGWQVYVQARVGASAPLNFMLDSGAGETGIDARRARELNLQTEPGGRGSGAGERSYARSVARGVELDIGGATLKPEHVAVVDYSFLEPFAGRRIDGIIGYEIFQSFVVEIDYATYRVNLYAPESYRHDGRGQRLALGVEGRLPFVSGRITETGDEKLELKFLVDTGAGTLPAILNRPFVEGHRLLEVVPNTVVEPNAQGMGGRVHLRVGRVGRLHLGKLLIERPVVGFFQDAAGFGASRLCDGLIGGSLLRRFRVTFDYAHGLLALDPNAQFESEDEYDMSGLGLIAGGADFRSFTVRTVMEKSPAAEASVRAGDKILTVNGAPAASFTLDQLRQMFKLEGRTYLLGIERKGRELQLKITLRRLV